MLWTDKYQPNSISEIVGNNKQIKQVHDWAKNWNVDSNPLILYGPPGVGKTTTAHLIGKKMDWEIMEMNASDKRTGSIINKIAGESSNTRTLTGKRNRLLILDEADNLHGHSDRGGKTAITKVIKQTNQPIILIANNYYDLTRGLRNATKGIEYKPVNEKEIAKKLRDICIERDINYDIPSLKKIAENSNGDVRAAINDLHKNASGKSKLNKSKIQIHNRNKEEKIFSFLDFVFKKGNPQESKEKSMEVDMTPDELFRWMNENIYKVYSNKELLYGLDNLTKSSLWLTRVHQTQNYKYWKYANDELTSGLSSARMKRHGGWTRWSPPKWSKKKGLSNDLLEKIASKSHCSVQIARMNIAPYLSALIPYCKPKELTIEIAAWYDLTDKEVSELTGSGKNTNKVQNIIKESKKIKQDFDLYDEVEYNSLTIKEEQSKTEDEEEQSNQASMDDFI